MEVNEKKDRVTDALNATRAAASEGIVPGGGTALIRCTKLLDGIRVDNDDQMAGVNIIKSALFKPCWTIVANTGIEPAVIVDKVCRLQKISFQEFGNAFKSFEQNLCS